MKTNNKFTVLRDNKEKVGYWTFSFAESVEAIEVGHIKTGDYSIKGLTDKVCLERKKTTGEIAINLGQKWKAFEAECERMSTIKWRYVICEFTIENLLEFPLNSGVPQHLWKYTRMRGKFMFSRINLLAEKYGIEFLFVENKENAEKKAIELLEHAFANS